MKVLVTGPESSGKSTLARALAWSLDGIYVAEQAREYLHARRGNYTEDDLPHIWAAQSAAEEAAEITAASFVICDTGPEIIAVWSRVKFGTVAEKISLAVTTRRYDLTLLCAPDLPWQADPLREAPDPATRQKLFGVYRQLLPRATIVHGSHRIEQAIQKVIETGRDAG